MASTHKNQKHSEDEMATVPWGAIIGALPSLIEASATLFRKAEAPQSSLPEVPAHGTEKQLEAVIARLEYFESLEADQAKLVKQTVEQLQNVTILASRLAMRANVSLVVAGASLLLAVLSIAIR